MQCVDDAYTPPPPAQYEQPTDGPWVCGLQPTDGFWLPSWLVCVVPDCQYAGFSPTSMLHPATKEQVAYMRLWRQGCLRLVNHTGHSATAILIGYFEFKRMNNNWWWVQRMNNNWWLALWVAGSWREFESCILLVLTVVVPNKFCSSFVVSHRA
jgi:hypothetical protein